MQTKRIAAIAAASTSLGLVSVAVAQITGGVDHAQPRVGSPRNLFARGAVATPVVHGTDDLENPAGIFQRYGYLDDAASQASGVPTKTEPDQNTYLVTKRSPGGPTRGYDYGTHFLFQGHEVFSGSRAYLTRINLDVTDPDHRITLLNLPGPDGNTGLTSIDGSTWDPFASRLLFTSEAGSRGGVASQPLKWRGSGTPPPLVRLDGSLGQGGYEGVQIDKKGNVYIVEDVGGKTVTNDGKPTQVKQPNSFVYRFVPDTRDDLGHGKLQALQVSVNGKPITFHDPAVDAAAARDDALGAAIATLHSGQSLPVQWVTIHDTGTDGTAAFDANAAAKKAGATPLKRPENGKFVPGSDFKSFVLSETGDTNTDAGNFTYTEGGRPQTAAARAAWGALLRVDLTKAGSDTGTIKTVVLGDAVHSSFDNVSFLDSSTVLAAEDRGDTLHQQLNKLDSLWSFDLTKSLNTINADGQRAEAQGRDPAATADANDHTLGRTNQNDGDNEVTGIHVSDGSTTAAGLLGRNDPTASPDVRGFVTQQHGANITFQLTYGPVKASRVRHKRR